MSMSPILNYFEVNNVDRNEVPPDYIYDFSEYEPGVPVTVNINPGPVTVDVRWSLRVESAGRDAEAYEFTVRDTQSTIVRDDVEITFTPHPDDADRAAAYEVVPTLTVNNTVQFLIRRKAETP